MDLGKKSIKSLKTKAWKLCSEFIRKREQKCFTCDTRVDWKEADAGHFIHGHNKLTFFEPDNIHKQCKRCNLYLSGNGIVYSLKMIDKFGRDRVDELFKISRNGKVHTRGDVIKWINFYTEKLEEIKSRT